MRIALGTDERTHLTDTVAGYLREKGHEVDQPEPTAWPEIARAVGEAVASGRADQGVLFCWTGTGVSIAANKVPGARAALCPDPETARGARKWNDANILCLSLRLTSDTVAKEILDAWFEATVDENERENIERVNAMDASLSC